MGDVPSEIFEMSEIDVSQGWVKLYRDMFAQPVAATPITWFVFTYLLTIVTHRTKAINASGNFLRSGQCLTSAKSIAEELGIARNSVSKALEYLSKIKSISVAPLNPGKKRQPSIITTLSWGLQQDTVEMQHFEQHSEQPSEHPSIKMQHFEQPNEQPIKHPSEQPSEHPSIKMQHFEQPNEQPIKHPSEQPSEHLQECKNIKNEENKNTYSSNLFEGWSSTLTDTPVENTHPNQTEPDAQPPAPEPAQPDDTTNTTNTTPKAKPHKTTKKSEPKESYGEYGNVRMTKDEYHKLLEKFGDELAHSYIDQLDLALGTKNYGYKSHYMAILKWERSGYFNARSSARPQQYRKTTGFDMDEAREVSNRVLQRLMAESKS